MLETDYLKDSFKYVERLMQIPTLSIFEEKDLKGLLELSKIRKYRSGELIIKEGMYDCWIYFLISGSVRIEKHGEDLQTLKRTGDVFGEMGIIDGSPRSASVYAVNETVCLATDASYLDRLTGKDQITISYIIYRIFSEILANRLRLTSDELIKTKEELQKLRSKFM